MPDVAQGAYVLCSIMHTSKLACPQPSLAPLFIIWLQREYDMYWHERMTLLVPRELNYHLFPWLADFEANIERVRWVAWVGFGRSWVAAACAV